MAHNVVVTGGKNYLISRVFESTVVSSQAAGLFLHSASTGVSNAWANISASQVVSYGTAIPRVTFSNYNSGVATGSASYGFTAGPQTVSGAGVIFYSATEMSTALSGTQPLLYAYGTFNSRQVANSDTLNVTLSVSLS
jgi:hypothetical protein